MFPIGHEAYKRRITPIIVYLLIAINIAVFLVEIANGERFISGYSAIPYEIIHGKDLIRPIYIPGIGDIPQSPGPRPIYLTLLTSMFMHGGFMHIAGNMLYLAIFGDQIEDDFGHLKFLAFYLITGLTASFAQIVMEPDSVIPSLGASGAIAGVLGAYIAIFPNSRIRVLLPIGFIWTTTELPALIVIGFWIIIQFFNEFGAIITHTAQATGVAYMAHIGGFIVGLMLSFLFHREREEKNSPWNVR